MQGEPLSRRCKEHGKLALMALGIFALIRFAMEATHPTYAVKPTLENLSADSKREPVAYLEKSWLFGTSQLPLRFQTNGGLNDWQYQKDGTWHSLNMTDIGRQIDAHYEPDDSDRPRDS